MLHIDGMIPPYNGAFPRRVLASWLAERLAAGRVESLKIAVEAKLSGHARSTLLRAKKSLGIVSERTGMGPGAVWYWKLPEQADEV